MAHQDGIPNILPFPVQPTEDERALRRFSALSPAEREPIYLRIIDRSADEIFRLKAELDVMQRRCMEAGL